MSESLTVYHKPGCSKCRIAVGLLRERGAGFAMIDYYQQRLTAAEFRAILDKLRLAPRDVLRKDEPVARTLGVDKPDLSDDELIKIMIENPDLIQRPIVVRGNEAVLGRPPSNIEKLL